MFKSFSRYQGSFAEQPYQFKIFELWREAFRAAKPVWFTLILADIALLVVMHFPQWAPILLKYFPALTSLTPSTAWMQSTPFFAFFSHLSIGFFPLLYAIFVTIPVYLGMNLIALRAAYGRPFRFNLLAHYLTIFWWMQIVSVLFFAFVIFFPILYGLFYFSGRLLMHDTLPQVYVGLFLLLGIFLWLVTMFSMVLNLTFGARVNVVSAIAMSWKTVRLHLWRVFGMFLISYLVWNVGMHTGYLSDLLLMPPNLMAWALLYRRMFADKGLIE